MNNVISIIVDSVIKEYVGTDICAVSPTPFLDSLRMESIVAENLYSPAPFTDAATKSLFTGRDCLDDYSFFFKYSSSPTNHYKSFKENGYETIGIYYPYYIVGKNVTDYIDHLYYASGFVFGSEWFGMFSYFADILKERELTTMEYNLLVRRFELMIDVWIKFYNDILTQPDSSIMIKKCIGSFDVSNALKILLDEKENFISNPHGYITDFLVKGKNHKLASLDKIDVEGYIDKEFLRKDVYKKYDKLFRHFFWSNLKANWKRFPSLKRLSYMVRQSIKTRSIREFKCLANYYLCLSSFHRMRSLSLKPFWQYEQSSYRHFETAKYAIEHRDSDKPFYLSVHVEEPHNYIACFSYDVQDKDVISEEMEVLSDYVKKLGGRYKGDLSYILSIRYADYQIEKFCQYLKESGLWDNTTLMVCADHGSSYSFFPLHTDHVNCFDKECYHIPLIIRKPNMDGVFYDTYCSSKDILPTLLDLEGLAIDKNITGSPIRLISNHDYVLTEYPNGGCPDVLSKTLKLSIRNEKYVLCYDTKLSGEITDLKPTEIYYQVSDPNCYYNIAECGLDEEMLPLHHIMCKYIEKVREVTYTFIRNNIGDNETSSN